MGSEKGRTWELPPKKNYRNSNYFQLTAFPQKCGPFQWQGTAPHASPCTVADARDAEKHMGDIMGIYWGYGYSADTSPIWDL